MNKAMLKSYIVRYGDTQGELAKALGISLSNLSAKINGASSFRQTEINLIKQRYALSADDIANIFFAD